MASGRLLPQPRIRYPWAEVSITTGMKKFFLPTAEAFDLVDWNKIGYYTKSMYSFLPELRSKTGKTYCISHLCWPTDDIIAATPPGYDTYVLTFPFEYPDFEWIQKFCKQFSQSKVLLIYPFSTCKYKIDNLDIIDYQGWPILLDWYSKEVGYSSVDFARKNKKLSSLCNRINQGRVYVSAYLHQTWDPSEYVLSYHGWDLDAQRQSYILDKTGRDKIDRVIDYFQNVLMHQSIVADQWARNSPPLDNLHYDWPAYTDCLINCSNESVDVSDVEGHRLPGPYITEKTFKCMLSQTALLPVGQYKTYGYLEELGFVFDYPWDKSFDDDPHDMNRFSKIFEILDSLQDLSIDHLKHRLKDSADHNRNHITSGAFLKLANEKNDTNIQQFYES